MKYPQAALLAAGRISASPLRRLPALTRQIGMVYAPTPGLATKFCRTLRCPHPLRSPEELQNSPLWILHGPGATLPTLVKLVLSTNLPLTTHTLAHLDENSSSSALAALGVPAATFWPSPLEPGPLFFTEGDPAALRHLERWLRQGRIPFHRLTPGSKPRFVAAMRAAAALVVPLLEALSRSLLSSGLSRPLAQKLSTHWIDRQLRAYRASGRRAWANPSLPHRWHALEAGLRSLEGSDPLAAELLEETLIRTLKMMG